MNYIVIYSRVLSNYVTCNYVINIYKTFYRYCIKLDKQNL